MTVPDGMDERLRTLGLVEAERMAQALFADAMARDVIMPGRSAHETGTCMGALARQMFGPAARRTERVIRCGPHTMTPYAPQPPDHVVGEDDIVVVDLGPVLGGYETEFARTVAFGDDPHKHSLVEDLPKVFAAGREAYSNDGGITGRRLYAEVQAVAAKSGWTLGGWHVGHLVGADPAAHAHPGHAYLCADNDQPLRRTVQGGWQARWILEIHLIDEHQGFGGTYKGLLDLR